MSQTERTMTDQERAALTCLDCPALYGKDGWCDVVVPDEIWNAICPKGGVLCFRCMTKRIEAAGLTDVPVIVASGPYRDNNERWRQIGFDHGRLVGLEEHAPARLKRREADVIMIRAIRENADAALAAGEVAIASATPPSESEAREPK